MATEEGDPALLPPALKVGKTVSKCQRVVTGLANRVLSTFSIRHCLFLIRWICFSLYFFSTSFASFFSTSCARAAPGPAHKAGLISPRG